MLASPAISAVPFRHQIDDHFSKDAVLSAPTCFDRVVAIAKKTFPEIALAFALNVGVLCFFGGIPLSVGVFTGAMIGVIGAQAIDYAISCYYGQKPVDPPIAPKRLARASIASTIGESWPSTAIHESGHALAALSCFRDARPVINVEPFGGGMTTINPKTLTHFGEKIGRKNALLLFAAGGMIASVVFALFEFSVAWKLKEAHPHLSDYMNGHAFSQVLQEVVYGLSTFFASSEKLSQDFMRLWVSGGIHPLIPIALLVAIPLMELALLKVLDWRRQAEKTMVFSPAVRLR